MDDKPKYRDPVEVNTIHTAVLAYIRESAQGEQSDMAATFAAKDDAALVRMMFSSYRGKDSPRGLRLSQFGLNVMKKYFRGYEIPMAEGEKLQASHLLYLDAKATMPYYCDAKGFVIYDQALGTKLKLAGGRVAVLIEIEAD